MKLKYFREIMILSICLTACAKSYESPSDSLQFHFPVDSGESIQTLVSEADVACAETNCPSAIGQIIEREEVGTKMFEGTCTGWFITSNIVATNSHCIPEQVKADPSKCSRDLGIKLPAENGLSEESYFCTSLIKFSDISARSFSQGDYAFFQVGGHTNRTPLRVARSAVPEATQLDVYVVDPSRFSGSVTGRIHHRHCETHQGSVVMSAYNYDYSDVVAGFGDECKIIRGNSGSPAFDSHGEVPAILFATGADDMRSAINRQARQVHVAGLTTDLNVGLMASFVCADLPAAIGAPKQPSECESSRRQQLQKQAQKSAANDLVTPVLADQSNSKSRLQASGPQLFKYKVEVQQTGSVRPSPVNEGPGLKYDVNLQCLKQKADWKAGTYSTDGHTISILYDVPSFQYQLFLDSYARVRVKRSGSSDRTIQIKLDMESLKSKSEIEGTMSSSDSAAPINFKSHWCSNSELAQQ